MRASSSSREMARARISCSLRLLKERIAVALTDAGPLGPARRRAVREPLSYGAPRRRQSPREPSTRRATYLPGLEDSPGALLPSPQGLQDPEPGRATVIKPR